jgi:hypothetical protein
MPQPHTNGLAESLLQRLSQAAAPGGALTRRPVVAGMAAGLLAIFCFLGYLSYLEHRAADPAAMRLADPELAGLPTRSHIAGDVGRGRLEVREYGFLDSPSPDATLIMLIPTNGQAGAHDFLQELRGLEPVRNATRATMAATYDLQTRFGNFLAVEVQIDMVGRWKDCIAFFSRFDTGAVQIKGWYCSSVGAKPDGERLACALDGLTIDTPLVSDAADSFMRQHMARPSFCSALGQGQGREPRLIPPASTGSMQ